MAVTAKRAGTYRIAGLHRTFLLAPLFTLAVVCAIGLGVDAAFAGRAIPRLTVAGIEVGTLPAADLRALLEQEIGRPWAAASVDVRGPDGRTWSTTNAAIAIAPDVDRAVADALAYGRTGSLPQRLAEWSNALRGMPLIDLIGEGNVGLLTAARKFDPDQGVKFISYAVWWIRQAILSSLARQGRTVRVPLNRTADLSRIIKASEILRQKMRREPTPEELSQLTGLSVDVVQSLAALNTGDVRLDAPMDPEGDRSLIERFVADEMPDTEEEAMNRFLNDEIETALSTLPPRDAKVLRLYFGLEGGREHTLEEIGSLLGVTRERVRQLRDRALKRLREGDVGRALGSFAA